MPNFPRHLVDTYFSFDTRSLGAFRIALAGALLLDLVLRARVLDTFYTNEGILPNHTILWAPPDRDLFSLFFSASHARDVVLWMIGCGGVFVLLALGLYTKWAQILSLIAAVSLNTRIAPLENGGDIVLNLLCIWSLVLPLGERFSLDAIRLSLRRREQQIPEELNDRTPIRTPARRVYSLACLALVLQFCAIYWLNAVQKNGPTWLSGDAVHYALHQDRIVKWPGVWLREHASVELLRALTFATIGLEALAALLIINPFGRKYTRLSAVLLLPAMHAVFDSMIDVGMFSFAMMAFFPLLLEPSHWEGLRRRAERWHRRRRVYVDVDCGFCMLCARLLARLDALERLEFASNADEARLPDGITLAHADESITTLDLETGRVHRGADAFAALIRSLPFGFLIALPLQAPGLRIIAELAYERVARNRLNISLWLGYGACGIAQPSAAEAGLESGAEWSPSKQLVTKLRRFAAEAVVFIFMLASISELVNSNEAFPRALAHTPPDFFRTLIHYPRAFQTWHMFAPHAPLEDAMIEVDAVTADGRRVDPFNELGSRIGGPAYTQIPTRLNQDQFFCGYSLFAWQPHFRPYTTAFQEWILRYPQRTGREADRIVSFKVFTLTDRSPPPGQTVPTDFKRHVFLSYP